MRGVRRARARWFGGLVPTLALLAVGIAWPPAASAVTIARWSVTMVSDAGEYIGQGLPRTFHEGNATKSTLFDGTELHVNVSGGTNGDSFSLTFAAPRGQTLVPGLYQDAQRTSFREGLHPGIDIGGSGRGCNTIKGRFDVLDVARNVDGTLRRLWLQYEQHCEGGLRALFGEIRIGQSERLTRAIPARIWFPDTYPGGRSAIAPVTVWDPAEDVSVSPASLVGRSPTSFSIRNDTCAFVELGPGDACVIYVQFNPSNAGPKTGRLKIPTTAGDRVVDLDGLGIAGVTTLDMTSDPGDWVGNGGSYHYSGAVDRIAVNGAINGVHFGVDAANRDWWNGSFVPGEGDIIAPGTYHATRYPFNGSGPGMSVTGNGRGCNTITGTFTVLSAAFSATDGSLRSLDVTFEQHCEGEPPALRGRLKYRVLTGDTTAPNRATGLSATPSTRSVQVSWTNPTDSDLATVILRFGRGPAAPPLPVSQRLGGAGKMTTMNVTGLSPNTTYRFSVFTVDKKGNFRSPATIAATTTGL